MPGAPLAPRVSSHDAPARVPPPGVTPYSQQAVEDVIELMSLPRVSCNNCQMAESCPQYKVNHECAYDSALGGLSVRDFNNIIPRLEVIADTEFEYAMRALMVNRRQAGGALDAGVLRALEIAKQSAIQVAQLKQPQKAVAERSLTVIEKTSGSPQPGGGLLTQLLASVTGQPPPPEGSDVLELNSPEVITVSPENPDN